MQQTRQSQLISTIQQKTYKLKTHLTDQSLKLTLYINKDQQSINIYQMLINDLSNPQIEPFAKYFDNLQDLFDHIQDPTFLKVCLQSGKIKIVGLHPSKKNVYRDIGQLQLLLIEQQKKSQKISLEKMLQICNSDQQPDNKILKNILGQLVKQIININKNKNQIKMENGNKNQNQKIDNDRLKEKVEEEEKERQKEKQKENKIREQINQLKLYTNKLTQQLQNKLSTQIQELSQKNKQLLSSNSNSNSNPNSNTNQMIQKLQTTLDQKIKQLTLNTNIKIYQIEQKTQNQTKQIQNLITITQNKSKQNQSIMKKMIIDLQKQLTQQITLKSQSIEQYEKQIKQKLKEQDLQLKKMIMNQKLVNIKNCTQLNEKLTGYIQKNTEYLDTMTINIANNAQTLKNLEQKNTQTLKNIEQKNINFYIKCKQKIDQLQKPKTQQSKLNQTNISIRSNSVIEDKYKKLSNEVLSIEKQLQQIKRQVREDSNLKNSMINEDSMKKFKEFDQKLRKIQSVMNQNKAFVFSHINNLTSENKALTLALHKLNQKIKQNQIEQPKTQKKIQKLEKIQKQPQPPKTEPRLARSRSNQPLLVTRSIGQITPQKKTLNTNRVFDGENQIQIIDGKSALSQVDMNARYFCHFMLRGMDVVMGRQDDTYTMVVGTKNLRKINTFSVKLKKIRQWIYIGMVDITLKDKQWCTGNDNAIKYSNNLKLFDGKQWRQKVGAKFYEGQTVRLRVDFDSLIVQWEVGNQVRCKWICSSKLKFKQIQWVPMIEMGFKGDTVQWVD